MPIPRLYGPFQLTENGIDAHLQSRSAGVYALGNTRGGLFVISYVGRSDADLKAGLKTHIPGPYREFKFTYALSPRDAFAKQCEVYHESVGLESQPHPAPPEGAALPCARCQAAGQGGQALSENP